MKEKERIGELRLVGDVMLCFVIFFYVMQCDVMLCNVM